MPNPFCDALLLDDEANSASVGTSIEIIVDCLYEVSYRMPSFTCRTSLRYQFEIDMSLKKEKTLQKEITAFKL